MGKKIAVCVNVPQTSCYAPRRNRFLKDYSLNQGAIAGVLGDQNMLQILTEPLQRLSQGNSNFDWQTAEAALQCIRWFSLLGSCREWYKPWLGS